MNYELLNKKIDDYLTKIKSNDSEIERQDLEEREEREKFYSSYDKKKILSMDETDLYEYLSKLWAMIIWGNKHYIINKYIEDNGFENLKNKLVYLLYGEDNLEQRWDTFKEEIKGFGPAMMSELLCYIYPNDCMIWNTTSLNSYKALNIKGIPNYNYQFTGKKYIEMTSYSKEIQKLINQKANKNYNLLFVDYFFWDSLRLIKLEEEKNIEISNNKNLKEKINKSFHTELKEKVKDIGLWLGFDASNEVRVGTGAIVDAVWDFSINNIGKVTYVFEIQTGGSIDSLIMNLLKASKYKNVQGIIAISDSIQLEKINKEAEEIFRDSNLKIQYWNQNEVLDVYDKLRSVNESVNKILHIDDSL